MRTPERRGMDLLFYSMPNSTLTNFIRVNGHEWTRLTLTYEREMHDGTSIVKDYKYAIRRSTGAVHKVEDGVIQEPPIYNAVAFP